MIVKTAFASAAGDTALWTPTAGHRFVLTGGVIVVPNGATCAAGLTTLLTDSGTTVMIVSNIVATTVGVAYSFVVPEYVSLADNNVLRINNSAAFTAYGIWVTVWGYEV